MCPAHFPTIGVDMRIVFLVALLGGAVFYSYIAFNDLSFLTRRGRLGPGFFPRIIGGAMIVMVLWAMWDALRDRRRALQDAAGLSLEGGFAPWRDAVILIALVLGYGVLLRLVGGFAATLVYMIVALSIMNPGRHVQNLLVAVLLPVGVYLLFDTLLNASMPPGLYKLPF
jgi:hypothetical protein